LLEVLITSSVLGINILLITVEIPRALTYPSLGTGYNFSQIEFYYKKQQ
jgi:hypothetical protein